VLILKEFALKISEEKLKQTELKNTGRIIGEIMPRVTDSSVEVRKLALDTIYLVLRIHFFLEGNELPKSIQSIGPLRAKITTTDQNELFSISKNLSVILSESIIKSHLSPLVENIFNTFGDVDIDGSNGSVLVLNGLIRTRGSEMEEKTTTYIKTLINLLLKHQDREQVVSGILHSIRGLAKFHTNIVFKTLINENVPHSK
jgi:hypothetical protein